MAARQNEFGFLIEVGGRGTGAMAENLFATGAFEIFNHAPKQEDLEKIHDHYAPVGEDALQLVISHILEVLKTKVSVEANGRGAGRARSSGSERDTGESGTGSWVGGRA